MVTGISANALPDRVGLGQLGASSPGTAYVASVVVGDAETVVRLVYPQGRVVDVPVPALPFSSPQPPVGTDRVLAVQVRVGDTATRCTALVSGPDGPQRVGIEWPLALGFAAAGIRTVFSTDAAAVAA